LTSSRYAEAGVDIDAKAAALARAKNAIRSTFTPGVLGDVGGFGGLFRPDFSSYREPVLVASTDGVGTKLKVAIEMGRHDACGGDLVRHCVNDILVQGARPLFFLDYIAAGKLEPGVVESVIEGIAAACRETGTALIGGETAEMPGFYASGEYDVAGTIVGVVDRGEILDGSRVAAGDIVVGLPSVGLQTNGYTLARKVFFEEMGLSPADKPKQLGGLSVGDALLAPHLSYLKALEPLLEARIAHGMAHLTGGGFYDNIPEELERAARIDGASRFKAFWLIIMPLSSPGIIATAIYAFIGAWNEYVYQYILLTSERKMTVAVAIAQFFDADEAPWNYMMATAIVYAVPPIIIYYVSRRFMTSGLTMGGVKG